MNIKTPHAPAPDAHHRVAPPATPLAPAAEAAAEAPAAALRARSADDRVRQLLAEHILPPLGHLRRVLYLGCAEFASLLVIGEFARSVIVRDEDAAQVARARELAAAAGLHRLQFSAGGVEGDLPDAPFDLLCAGHILSAAADDPALDRRLQQLVSRLGPEASLLTQDWIGGDAMLPALRSLPTWRAAFERAGLRCMADHVVERDADGATHRLMQWQRAAAPRPSATPTDAAEVKIARAPGATMAAPADAPAPGRAALPPAAPDAAWVERIAEQQERQSEVLLHVGQVLLGLGDRLQTLEARGGIEVSGLQPVIERLERLESTLHWMARQPRGLALGPIRVVFLVHHAAAWPAIRGIVDTMRAAPDFDPVVVSLPHRLPPRASLGGEQQVHDLLSAQGYPHVRVTDEQAERALERVKQLNPQVIFGQGSWNADVPDGLRASMLSFAKLCCVPDGYLSTHVGQPIDPDYHRLCWRIFCPDDMHRELFTAHNLQAGRNCRVTGYPKFDHLARQAAGAGHWPIAPARANAFRLVWAPHAGDEDSAPGAGAFGAMAEDMLQFVAARHDVDVVLRPQAALRQAMVAADADTRLGRVRDRWNALPNAGWSGDEDDAGLFAASQALLTDGPSDVPEYQLFDKPLICFERPDHGGFNAAERKLLDGMYRVGDVAALGHLLERLVQGVEVPAIVEARRRIALALRPYPDEAARRIVDVIRREIQEI